MAAIRQAGPWGESLAEHIARFVDGGVQRHRFSSSRHRYKLVSIWLRTGTTLSSPWLLSYPSCLCFVYPTTPSLLHARLTRSCSPLMACSVVRLVTWVLHLIVCWFARTLIFSSDLLILRLCNSWLLPVMPYSFLVVLCRVHCMWLEFFCVCFGGGTC